MKTNITTSIVVTLVLSHEEAAWLNAAMQNPFHCEYPGEESSLNSEMRLKFFEATKQAQLP